MEEYLRFPYGLAPDNAAKIEQELQSWGEQLFELVFRSSEKAREFFQAATYDGLHNCELVITSDDPTVLNLPWELLYSTSDRQFLAPTLAGMSRSLIHKFCLTCGNESISGCHDSNFGSNDNNFGSDDNNSGSNDSNCGSDDNNSGSNDSNCGSDDSNCGSDDNNFGSDDNQMIRECDRHFNNKTIRECDRVPHSEADRDVYNSRV